MKTANKILEELSFLWAGERSDIQGENGGDGVPAGEIIEAAELGGLIDKEEDITREV